MFSDDERFGSSTMGGASSSQEAPIYDEQGQPFQRRYPLFIWMELYIKNLPKTIRGRDMNLLRGDILLCSLCSLYKAYICIHHCHLNELGLYAENKQSC